MDQAGSYKNDPILLDSEEEEEVMEGKGKGKGKGKEKVDTSEATEASSQNDSASSAMVSHVCTTSFGDETPSSRSRRPHSQPVLPSRSLRLNGPNPTPLKWQKKCWNETCASGICLHCRRHQPVPLGVAWRGLPRCGFRAQLRSACPARPGWDRVPTTQQLRGVCFVQVLQVARIS